jgi:hypothetical protein
MPSPLDNAADVIVVLAADGTIRLLTPSIEDVLGCDFGQGDLFGGPASAARIAALAGSSGVSSRRGGAGPRAATRAS